MFSPEENCIQGFVGKPEGNGQLGVNLCVPLQSNFRVFRDSTNAVQMNCILVNKGLQR
jgi:hypothetical protein